MGIAATLTEIFREVFDDDEINVFPEMTADDVENWDSLSHVNLIVAIEAEFNIRFSRKELMTLNNVGKLIQIISEKVVKS